MLLSAHYLPSPGCLFGRLFISLLVFSAGSFLGLAAIQPVCKTFQRNLVDIDTTKYFHHTERFLWRSIKCKTTSSFYDNPLAALFLVVILEIPNIKWRENVLPTIQFNSVSIPFHSIRPTPGRLSSRPFVGYLPVLSYILIFTDYNYRGPCCNKFLLIDY